MNRIISYRNSLLTSSLAVALLNTLASADEPLNLGFESGVLSGWTATGDAWKGQPIKGDTVIMRGRGASDHNGDFWLGGYEISKSDKATGTLTSAPFKVTHPWASILIGGGKHAGTRVEIVDRKSQKVLFKAHGEDSENMRQVVIDLRQHQGKDIVVRIVDEVTVGWGHVNYDDFRFHDSKPVIKPARLVSSPLLKHLTPNPATSDKETVTSMWVPEGFQVDLIASEPAIRQPIAFTFDAKGRIWLAEALAYPHRQEKGNDRLVILSDEDGNGSFETKTIFADNLNLVSGFEIGYGGVFVGAAPELLFIPDADNDDKPDSAPVVLLDGWDLKDTHETPNSFMWGHDGWLYGCHGVFNDSLIGKPGSPKDQRVFMNAGVWRYHPLTQKFEIYAHGGSNQWGLDYNESGAMFMTHCRSSWGLGPVSQVIRDGHYWTQNNGNHKAFIATAKVGWNNVEVPLSNLMRSISKYGHGEGGAGANGSRSIYGGHSHVGTMVYLGDNWPDSYRGNLYTHNLHGHQMNREKIISKDSGYQTESEGHDQLYAPHKRYLAVDLKYGPDGAVYMIDWQDTQQCHTNDHAVWDRTNGRIYRMAWTEGYKPSTTDLTKSTDNELIKMLAHRNEWFARMAQHQLRQRAAKQQLEPDTKSTLLGLMLQQSSPHRFRIMVALYGIQGIDAGLYRKLLGDPDETIRAQAVHFITEQEIKFSSLFQTEFNRIAQADPSARVRLALAGACQYRIDKKIARTLLEMLAMRTEDASDQFIPKMVWFGYAQFADQDMEQALAFALKTELPLLRESIFWYAASKTPDKAVKYALQLKQQADVSRMIAIFDQAIDQSQKHVVPSGWQQLIDHAQAGNNIVTQKHLASLQLKFGGKIPANETPQARIARGKAAFMICAACHASGKDQPGPSLEEIAQVYNTKEDVIKWVRKPGKKREKYPIMPAFDHMENSSLELISEYLLSLKK